MIRLTFLFYLNIRLVFKGDPGDGEPGPRGPPGPPGPPGPGAGDRQVCQRDNHLFVLIYHLDLLLFCPDRQGHFLTWRAQDSQIWINSGYVCSNFNQFGT